MTQVKSSMACEEKQREDCQTIEWEECREKPKISCKKTLVTDHTISLSIPYHLEVSNNPCQVLNLLEDDDPSHDW